MTFRNSILPPPSRSKSKPVSSPVGNRRLCLPLDIRLAYFSTLKRGAVCFSDVSLDFHPTARHIQHSQRCDNLKSNAVIKLITKCEFRCEQCVCGHCIPSPHDCKFWPAAVETFFLSTSECAPQDKEWWKHPWRQRDPDAALTVTSASQLALLVPYIGPQFQFQSSGFTPMSIYSLVRTSVQLAKTKQGSVLQATFPFQQSMGWIQLA
jgi:hypothetical protein